MTDSNDKLEDLDQSLIDSHENQTGNTVASLYERLLLEEDLILTIATADADNIKRSLVSYKGKLNAKLKRNNLPADTSRMKFTNLGNKGCEVGQSRLQITVSKPKSLNIIDIKKAGDF